MGISDSSVNSTETPYRYAAYATRIRTILISAHRYVGVLPTLRARRQLTAQGRLHFRYR